MATQLVEIEQIRIDGDTQSRERIDEAAVGEYAEALERGERFPAVEVFFDGKDMWLAGGFHRWHAHRKAGKTKILANVLRGTREEAQWHACAENRTHGLRRTRADIERAVKLALRLRPNESDRKLAEHCGVVVSTVGNWRTRTDQPNPRGRVSNLDKTAPKPLQGKDRDFSDDEPPMDDETGQAAADFVEQYRAKGFPDDRIRVIAKTKPPALRMAIARALEGAQEPPKADDADKEGNPIPEKLKADFARANEVQVLMTTISRIKGTVLAKHSEKDRLFADINPSQFQAECENVYRSLRACLPHAVCPYCKGRGCRACMNRGWVGVFAYQQAPAEMKKGK